MRRQLLNAGEKAGAFIRSLFVLLLCLSTAGAAEQRGQVIFNGFGVPGAVVTATNGEQTHTALTGENGGYLFADLPEGTWNIRVDMQAFAILEREVTVGSGSAVEIWEMRLLPLDQIPGLQTPPTPPQSKPAAETRPAKGSDKKSAPQAVTNTQTPFQRADVNATSAAL